MTIENASVVDIIQKASRIDTPGNGELFMLLEEMPHKMSLKSILQLLSNDSSEVRAWAVWALGEKNTRKCITPLLAFINDKDERVRLSSLRALNNVIEKHGIKSLDLEWFLPMLRDPSPQIRAATVDVFQYFSTGLNCILNCLNDDSPLVRSQAALALRYHKYYNPDAVDKLLVTSGDKEIMVRIAAIEGLFGMEWFQQKKNPLVINRISEMMNDNAEAVRTAAKDALAKLGLYDLALDIQEPSKQVESQKNSVVEEYIYILQHGSHDEKKIAAQALGEQDCAEAAEALVMALLDKTENYLVRMSVANALGNRGDLMALKPLIQVLNETYSKERDPTRKAELESLRDAVVFALEVLSEPGAPDFLVDALIHALKDEFNYVRAQACSALGIIGNPRATKYIKALINDPDGFVRYAARDALVSLEKHI